MIQLDLFTLVAQILNFLILVLLLKHFLYGRIVGAMDKRESMIASRLQQAEESRKEAESEAESFRSQKRELDSQRERLFEDAREEVQGLKQDLTAKARREVDESRARWIESIEREKTEFLKELRSRAGTRIMAVAGKVLRDLADEDLERRITSSFVERLRSMTGADAETVTRAFGEAGNKVTVRSSFELNQEGRTKVREALKRMDENIETRFVEVPDIMGIELDVGDLRVSWSLKNYLGDLEEGLSKAVESAVK